MNNSLPTSTELKPQLALPISGTKPDQFAFLETEIFLENRVTCYQLLLNEIALYRNLHPDNRLSALMKMRSRLNSEGNCSTYSYMINVTRYTTYEKAVPCRTFPELLENAILQENDDTWHHMLKIILSQYRCIAPQARITNLEQLRTLLKTINK